LSIVHCPFGEAVSWGSLGDIVFDRLCGPEEESLKMGVDYAEHKKPGRKPSQQFTGDKLDELEWTVLFHRSLNKDVDAALLQIKAAMKAHEILDLVIGEQAGETVWAGQWVIHDFQVEEVKRAPGGATYSARAKIKMKEWAEKEGLEVSKRKPPPAVKTAAPKQQPLPASAYRTERPA
jgi:phage protein U